MYEPGDIVYHYSYGKAVAKEILKMFADDDNI
jgi:hypothetical protein